MDQLTITFITATSALVSGIAGPLVSMRVARRQINATVISYDPDSNCHGTRTVDQFQSKRTLRLFPAIP